MSVAAIDQRPAKRAAPARRAAWLAPRSVLEVDSRLVRPSRAAKLLKIILPIVSLGLVGLLALWPHIGGMPALDLPFPDAVLEGNRLRMTNPRFQGLDKQNRPYVLTADTATQTRDVPREITLDKPVAEIRNSVGGWYLGKARSGLYREADRRLDLQGDIEIFSSDGYELRGEQASFDLNAGTVLSDAPVSGQGPIGVIKGNALVVGRNEKVVYLYGGVSATLYPRREGG